MILRFLRVFVLVLWSAGCNRQHNQQPVSAPPGGQATATTAQAPNPGAGPNPEPVERPPVEGVVPAEPSQPVPAPAPAPSPAPAALGPAVPNPAVQNSMPVPAPGPASHVPRETAHSQQALIIPAGTRIRVRMGQSLDSKHSRPGERFVAYLNDPVVSGDRVIVPRGTTFEGHVIEAKSSGWLRRQAYLGVKLDSFRLHSRTYAIVTAADVRASASYKKRNLAIIGGGAGTGATIGTTAAFITGRKNVKLPVETPLVFSLRGAVAVGG
jgi:hypothetical protein